MRRTRLHARLRIDTTGHFLRDLVVRPRYSLFMNGARSAPNKGTKMSFAKMSDLAERAKGLRKIRREASKW